MAIFEGPGYHSPDIPAGYQDRISVIDQFEDAPHRPHNIEHQTSKPLKPLSPEAVQSTVRQAVQAAIDFQDSFITARRRLADLYYQGLVPELPNLPDRSQVNITAVRDAVKAVTASLARIFTQTDKVGEFYSDDEEDERMCIDASTFINAIFWRFGGYRALIQMGTDALKSMIGIVKVAMLDVPYTVHSSMPLPPDGTPMSPLPEGVEITEMNDTEIVLTQKKTRKVWSLEAVPGEEFLIDPEAADPDSARLVAHRRSIYLYQAVEMGFEPEAVLPFATTETNPGGGDSMAEIEKTGRRGYPTLDEGIPSADPLSRRMLMTECYLRIDADGDGVAELRRIVCGGETYQIISDEPVNYRPFAIASADLQPHVFFPICLAEDLMQDQLAQTALLRSIIDNAAFVNQPRTEVNENMVNINDVKNSGIGAIVRVKQIGQINELVTPFVAGQTLPVLQYLADVSQSRSGVTKLSQGLDPDQLQSTTRVAAQAAVSAADARIEMMARNIGETGVASLFVTMLKVAIFNLQGMQSIKVPQGFQEVRPEWWHDQVGVKVNVGLGSGQIDEKKQLLAALLEKQMAIVAQYGPANPVCGWTNVQETLRTLMRLSGIRNTQDYFPFVPPEMVQKLDEQQKAASQEQQKIQMASMQAQMQLQKQQADAATDLAKAENKKAELKYQADISKMQTNYVSNIQKLQAQIAQMKSQSMTSLSKDLLVDDRERDKMQLQFIADMEKVGVQLEQIKQAAAQAQAQSEESKAT